jgi:multidrug efflux pump subunit AcrA (membrane-fusion protein)
MYMTRSNSKFGRRTVLATAGLGLATVLGVAAAFAAPQPPAPSIPPAPAVPAPVPAPVPSVYPAPGLPPELSRLSSIPGAEPGITRPSDQSDLFFPIPGVVSKVYVKAGDAIKANQLIAQQDDRAEAAKVKEAEAAIKVDELQIRAADADLKLKKALQRRQHELYADLLAKGISNSEIDEADANFEIASIAVDYRKQTVKTTELKLAEEQVTLDQRKLKSPINGVVAKVDLHAGEGTDIQRPAGIQIVQNDPLWVELNVPVAKADSLRLGQELPVQYVEGGDAMQAKIILLAPVANAGANVRIVRLQMPNPVRKDGTQREAGRQVLVKLPEPIAGAQTAR